MKKRIIGFTILGLIVTLGAFMLYSMQKKIKQKKAIQENIRSLPDFTFYHLEDSSQFTPKDLVENQSILLIYFNSECEHCQYEASEIYKQQAQFKDTQVLLISSESIKAIQSFSKKYKLTQIPFLKVLKVDVEAFYKSFGSLSVPSIFIYDTDHKLVKNFKGEVKIEKLLEYTDQEIK
jgi:peroxiredoxin